MHLHASCVSIDGKGLLILGESGAGKTGLALELMTRGARLVSDDQVLLRTQKGTLIASAPPTIRAKIELRGFGIVSTEHWSPEAPILAAIQLQEALPERLPEQIPTITLACYEIPAYPASVKDGFLAAKVIIFMQSLGVSSPADALHLARPGD